MTFNVAGNRASQAPRIAAAVTAVLKRVHGDVADEHGA
jgi:hypothetical protein